MNLPERITQLRRRQGLSQVDLAKRIGASRSIVGNYERGTNTPSLAALRKLAEVFGVSMDYLSSGGDAPPEVDREALDRLKALDELSEDDRQRVYHYIDLIARDSKARKAYTKS